MMPRQFSFFSLFHASIYKDQVINADKDDLVNLIWKWSSIGKRFDYFGLIDRGVYKRIFIQI